LLVAHQAERNGEGPPLVAFQKLAEGLAVALLRALDKLCIVLRFGHSGLSVGRPIAGAIHGYDILITFQ
jgi:hypothetical protein